jgi:hypothetical protein
MRSSKAVSLDITLADGQAHTQLESSLMSLPQAPVTARGPMRGAVVLATLLAWLADPAAAIAQAACTSPKDDLFANPFTYTSAHHRPIGTGAIYASDTANATKDWLKADLFNINNGNPSGTSLYEVDDGDPFVQINPATTCTASVGMPINMRIPLGGFPPSTNVNTLECPDNEIVVYDYVNRADPNDDKVYQLRQFFWNGGSPRAQRNRFLDIRGLGHGLYYGDMVGAPASGVATLFGVLRGVEIGTPGRPIEHALSMGLPRKVGPGCNVMLSRDVRLPATNRDANATQANYNTGHIPYGALMAIPRSVNILSLGLGETGVRLAAAIQNYGIYITNGGGCTSPALDADQYVTRNQRLALQADIKRFYPFIRMVLNNDVFRSTVAGGGTPLAPNCAFDAP